MYNSYNFSFRPLNKSEYNNEETYKKQIVIFTDDTEYCGPFHYIMENNRTVQTFNTKYWGNSLHTNYKNNMLLNKGIISILIKNTASNNTILETINLINALMRKYAIPYKYTNPDELSHKAIIGSKGVYTDSNFIIKKRKNNKIIKSIMEKMK